MQRNTLIIIPNLHHKYSFSAPLAWIFSEHVTCVHGIYSEEITPAIVKKYRYFILECNWFTELYEFSLIVSYIRKYVKDATIMFGGLYSQLKYEDIFQKFDVDLFIKGFCEEPIKMFLNGVNLYSIPNLVGKTFENETTFFIDKEYLKTIRYNLDWFPSFQKQWNRYPAPDLDLEPDFSSMPLYPAYNYPKNISHPEKEFRIPSKGGRYHLPMIITSRGGCSTIHDGCEYCMGAKIAVNREIYKRGPVVYTNALLISHIAQISDTFSQMTLYINSPFNYDFSGHYFDIDATIEIDTNIKPYQLEKIIYSFKRCKVHLALYEKGHQDTQGKAILENYEEYLSLEDEKHRIYFFSFKEDAESAKIPKEKRLYSEFVFPQWTNWNFYNDFDNAYKYSKRFFFITRQFHLYPFPIRWIFFIRNHVILIILFLLNKLGLFHPEREMS